MKLYSQKDVNKKALRGARIAVLGYGSQGRAHALNLKDSGFDVVAGVRKGGASWKKAKKDGLEVAEPVKAVAEADLIAMLVPDLARKRCTGKSSVPSRRARRCCSRTVSTFTSSSSSRAAIWTWC